MADNTTLNAGSGGDTMRDKDRSGVKTPIVALDLNPAGSETLMAGAMPVTGTFWQATQPVSVSTLPLPSGAATAAKQPALGIAGTASADVITIQGIASMTAVKVDGSAATQPVSGTVTANIGTSGSLALDATLTGGAQKSKLVDSGGTNVATVSAGGALKVDGSAATQPVSGTVSITANSAVNVAQVGGTNADTNSGNKSAGTQRVVIATDQPSLANALAVSQSGTWNVGTVTNVVHVDDNAGSLTVDNAGTFATQSTLQAGTALVGKVSAGQDSASLYNGTTAMTPKFAAISASSSGSTTVVAAVTSKKIRVLRWSLSSNGSVNVKWQSHVTPTDLTGLFYLIANAAAGGAYCPLGIFETVSGEALDINLSAAVAVGGVLTYVEV